MTRFLNSSESRMRATLSTCKKSSEENRGWGSEKCCSIRRLLRWSESHVRATLTTYKKSSEENRRSDQQRLVRSPIKRTNG